MFLFFIDIIGVLISLFCFGSIGHAPKEDNPGLIFFGIIGLLPIIFHAAVLTWLVRQIIW